MGLIVLGYTCVINAILVRVVGGVAGGDGELFDSGESGCESDGCGEASDGGAAIRW